MYTKIVIALCAIWVTIAIFTPSAVARAQDSDCAGVDLVFLVDESNSMKNNDAGDLRVDAVRFAVEMLGANVLYDCPDVVHRMSVIGFGDENGDETIASYVRDAQISPSRDDFGTWERARDAIKSQIPKPTANRGATDYKAAFEAANEQLVEWRNSPLDGGPRRRGVVMLTDGGPCVYALGCTVEDNSMNTQAYLDALEAYLDANGNQFPWRGSDNPDSVRIWLVAFRDTTSGPAFDYLNPQTSYGQMVRGAWERITSGHGGLLIPLRSEGRGDPNANRDVSEAIAGIGDVISGSIFDPLPCPEPFYIDPYLDQVTVRILKIGSRPDVALEDVKVNLIYDGPLAPATFAAGGSSGDAGRVDDYQADGPNEFYVIGNPSPGTWRLEVTGAECRDLNVAARTYNFQGRLLSPMPDSVISEFDEGKFYDPADPVRFRFELLHRFAAANTAGGGVESLTSLGEFPISAVVVVDRPDGSTQELTLVQGASGAWESQDPIQTPMAGTYDWRIEVKTPNGQQTEDVVRFQDNGSFNVKPVNRFHIEIIEPKAELQQPLNRTGGSRVEIAPMRVVAKIVDDVTGQPLSADQISDPDVDQAVLMAVVGINEQKSEPVPLTYDSAAGGWVATLHAGENGIPLLPGNHTVTVTLNRSAYNREQYRPSLQDGGAASVTTVRNLVLDGAIHSPDAQTPVPEYDEGQFVDPAAPVHLEYRLFGWGDATSPVLSLDQYALGMHAVIDDGSGTLQTLMLTPAEGEIWRSVDPIRLPHPGQYTWTISTTIAAPGYGTLITPLQQSGTFSVSQVNRFHIALVEPKAAVSYPINHYEKGKQERVPLPIAVELFDDDTKDRLTPQQLGSKDATGILSATVEMGNQVSAPVPLAFDPSLEAWIVKLADDTPGIPLESGRHLVRVQLNPQGYDATRYRPAPLTAHQDQVEFERIRVKPIVLTPQSTEIVQPAYDGTLGCLNSFAVPVAVPIYAKYQENYAKSEGEQQTPIDPEILTGGNSTSLARVFVTLPGGNTQPQEGMVSLVETADGTALMATFPMTGTPPGLYTVVVEPNPDALTDEYEFYDTSKEITANVTRTYSLLHDPSNCKSAGIGLLVLLTGCVMYMGFNFWRRPTGYLEVIETQNSQYGIGGRVIAERRLGRNPLLLLRPREVIRLKNEDAEVAKLVIKKGNGEQAAAQNPFDDGTAPIQRAARAVHVEVYDREGNLLVDPTLVRGGDPDPITANLELRYS